MKKTILCMMIALMAGMSLAQAPAPVRRSPLLQRTPSAAAAASEAQEEETKAEETSPRLGFVATELDLVLQAYSEQVKKTMLLAPDVPKVSITLKSPPDVTLTKEEYLRAIEVALSMNGVVLEPFGERFIKVLSRKTVRTEGIPLLLDVPAAGHPENSKVISQLIPFKYIPVAEGQKALEGFKNPNGLFQVFERTNSILVTDTQENVNRMLEVVKHVDIATPVLEEVHVRTIKYAVAADIKKALEEIVAESQKNSGEKESLTMKTSGAPGQTRTAPSSSRLLNLRTLQPQVTATPNETLTASVSDADRGMIRGKVQIMADERSNQLIVITQKANMDFFDRIIQTLDIETSPDVKVEVIRLKYADAEELSTMLNDLIGNSSSSTKKTATTAATTTSNRNLTRTNVSTPTRTTPTPSAAETSKLGELNKDNIKILADKRINGLVVMARSSDMRAVKEVIDNMDVKLAQVLIETVILQVSLSDSIQTGIDWVNAVSATSEQIKGTVSGGGGGLAPGTLNMGSGAGALTSALPIGSGLNYFMKSEKLNLAAIISASKSDSRTKFLASPILMTVDNKEATIEATQMRYLLKGYTYSGNTYSGSSVPDYEQRDIGLTVKVTPRINPNGTVVLTIEEKFEQVGESQTITAASGNGTGTNSLTTVQVPTVTTRKLAADVSVENRQTVVFGGLVQVEHSWSDTGIPILKDIPWIGKYLFGKTEQVESRQELLVFLTPYVLDDQAVATREAKRRKGTLSDPTPWEDGGWSSSELADPVSRREIIRRLEHEWERQDQERKDAKKIKELADERAQDLGLGAQAGAAKPVDEQENLRDLLNELQEEPAPVRPATPAVVVPITNVTESVETIQ